MGVDVADINRDGHDDFIVLDMQARRLVQRQVQREKGAPIQGDDSGMGRMQVPRNTLFLGRGMERLRRRRLAMRGVSAADWSWSAVISSMDLDRRGPSNFRWVSSGMFFDSDAAARSNEASTAGRRGRAFIFGPVSPAADRETWLSEMWEGLGFEGGREEVGIWEEGGETGWGLGIWTGRRIWTWCWNKEFGVVCTRNEGAGRQGGRRLKG